MRSYQFIILLGAAFGILFNGIALTLLIINNQLDDPLYAYQTYVLSILLTVYITNIAVAFILRNTKNVGIISIVSSIIIAIFFIPIPPGLPVAAVLMIGGILAIIRKPRKDDSTISK